MRSIVHTGILVRMYLHFSGSRALQHNPLRGVVSIIPVSYVQALLVSTLNRDMHVSEEVLVATVRMFTRSGA